MSQTITSHNEYNDRVIRELHLQKETIHSSQFFDCVFSECSITESIFQKCRFVNCIFKGCELSLLQIPESIFSSTLIENSKIIGVNWAQADWSSLGLGKPLKFIKSVISHSTFIGLNLADIRVVDCIAVDVDFREADLSRADFTGTDLTSSLFNDTNLTAADLSQARNYDIDPVQNIIKSARFSLPEAMSLLYSMDIELIDEA